MTGHDLVRVWKDPYQDRTDHPAGEITLEHGGNSTNEEVSTEYLATMGCCSGVTSPTCWWWICGSL